MYTTVEMAIDELKKGKVIIVTDDENRENEGDFIALAEFATPEIINFMAMDGRGLICVPVTQDKANQLDLQPMVENNSDPYGTAFTVSIDHETNHTGISAFERSDTILNMLGQASMPSEFKRPGHIFPLIAKNGGVLTRPGHTEAAVDLAKIAGAEPLGVICEIMNPDGTMARGPELSKIAEKFGLVMLSIEALVAYRKRTETLVEHIVNVDLPTKYGHFKAATFVDRFTGQEHMAIINGEVQGKRDVLVRVHSECLTGDAFGSLRCDCGPQLKEALEEIQAAGSGVLLYMRQEGRGIGLVNKMKAYKLQEVGYDTVEANEQLGFPDDARDYGIAGQMLKELGVTSISLLTNNPRKIEGLERAGIDIASRRQIEVQIHHENEKYMRTKKEKLGHLLLK